MLSALIPLLAVLASPAAAIDVDQTVYFQNLASNLTGAGLNLFLNALTVANTTQLGQDLINNLYQDQPFTIYAPVDAAWESSGLQNPPANRDLHSLLSYHIVGAEINKTTDVADPRQHSIFETALRTETVLLPGDRHQVIVLESAPNVTDPVILIRGDSWNATSIGNPVKYENLIVQPIDKILAVPSPLIKTLSQSGLALKANLGATEFVTFANSLNLSEALEDCHGCTFFVPVNDAFTAVAGQAAALNATQQTALLRNHVLNGTVKYSTEIGSGFNPISAAGSTISFSSNSSGAYFLSGNSTARVVRSDIPVSNGVVHLIDAVFLNTETDENKANEAVSEASSIAASATGGSPVIGNPPSAVASTPAAQTDNAAFSQYGSATKFSVLTVVLAALWA